jgi:SnoaL-like protein
MSDIRTKEASSSARWSVGGIFLEALATRDYERMATTLGPAIRFRALLPPGPTQWEGPERVTDAFRSWFGGADDFELVDATVGEIGGRLYLSWRIRVRPAPFGIGENWHVIEQHGYADATDSIETLDLLCSGFHPDRAPDHTAI